MKIKKMRNILLVAMVLSLMMAIFPFAPISAAGTPTLTLVNPSSGAPGAVLNGVVISGTNLTGATAVNLSGTGVTASNLVVNGAGTQITATLTITAGAAIGLRDVTVTAGGVTSAALAGGFSVTSTGAAVLSLVAPANVAAGGGFYATINITGANQLKNYQLKVNFDPAVVQMAGLELSTISSGITDGVVNGVTIPNFGWTYQPTPGTVSGTISLGGNVAGNSSASGNGYLAKVFFKVLGAAGSQTNLSLSAVDLGDQVGNETFPASPAPVVVAVSANAALVTTVTTNTASGVTNTGATLNGTLTGLGAATTVNLFLGYSTLPGGPYTLVAGPTATGATTLPLAFNTAITGLTAGTPYFFVAQAQFGTQAVTGAEMTFTTTGGVPTLTSLNPNTGAPGATLNGVVISGTNLTGATAVNLSGTGVTASNLVVNGAGTQITATLTITAGAAIGLRDVTVTAGGVTSAPLAGGFSVTSTGAAVLSLVAPANVAAGGGFYATINITGANQLKNYQLKVNFDPAVVQMAGLELSTISSGITDGVVNGVTIPNFGWTYQPTPGTVSGTVSLGGNLAGNTSASGNGYLAKVFFKVLGASGSQTNLSLFAIDLGDQVGNETFPASPAPVAVAVSANPALVTAVTTNAATGVANTGATLNGTLTGLGAATTVNLFLGYSTLQGGPYTLVAGPTATGATTLPLAFNTAITGLTAGTPYFFVAQAQFGTQAVTGAEMTFTTLGGVPTLTSLNPNTGAPGATLNGVVISGTNLTGATAVSFNGTGVTASNLVVNGAGTQITATLTITAGAALGPRDVTVTATGGTSAPLTGGFTVGIPGVAVLSLDAPANVAVGGGFYATINITGANQLNGYLLHLHFNPAVVQMAGLELVTGTSSGVTDGVINGVAIPNFGWSYQPTVGTSSGEILLGGHLPGISPVSGNGYLAKVFFKVVGAAGNQTSLSLSGIELTDSLAVSTFPVNPPAIIVAVSADPALVTTVTTNAATGVSTTAATLNGTLTGLGAATTVNLFLGYSTLQGGPYTMVAGPTATSSTSLPLAFNASITGLTAHVTYYFVAVAQFGTQTVTGAEMTFTTTIVGPANKLGFGQPPTSTSAGAVITPAVTVQIQDAAGNVVTADNTTQVTLAIGTNPASGTLSGTLTATASNGVATFSNLSINNIGTGYTLVATSNPALTAATSNAFNIVGPANKLGFGQQPSSVSANATITPAVTVQIQDLAGNVVPGDNTTQVTLAIGTNPAGGTLSGTLIATASHGVATFSNLAINNIGTGYTLVATSNPVLTAATSNPFNIVGPANKLGFGQQPSSAVINAVITPSVTVQIQDAAGNVVPSDSTTQVTLAIGTNPASGTLSGTLTATASSGVATFNNLSINAAGTGYTLVATSNPVLTGITSNAFNIIYGGGGGGGGGSSYNPPVVNSSSIVPAKDATGVGVSSSIKAVFSMAMDASTLTTTTFTLMKGTTPVAGTVSYDSATYTVTFTPASALDYSAVYTATITTGAKNTLGYFLASNFVWSFTTAAAPPPTTTPPTTTPPTTRPPTTTPPTTTPPTTTPPPTTLQPTISPTTPPPPPTPTNWGLIIGLIVVVLIIIGLVTFLLMRRNKAKVH